ncbi:DUF3696 domain-containing protein [Desulfobacterales bacterium HSG2]|nr:DUF3696 domain-containing protein [Desulfobacterales bacterium HSG2]
MIQKIMIQNFKSLKNIKLKVSDLNILTGLNGMGKSSLIQVLLLLRQSHIQGLLSEGLSLNGSLVEIGTAQDAFCESGKRDDIQFAIEFDHDIIAHWRFDYNPIPPEGMPDDFLTLTKARGISDYPSDQALFAHKFKYLSSARITPNPYFKLSDYAAIRANYIGNDGQNAITYLYADKLAYEDAFPEERDDLPLIDQVERWLDEISPGTKLKPGINPEMRLANIMYSFTQDSGETRPFCSVNVGFGITHVLPVIVALVSAEPGELIIIENPETNLHPRGQSKLAELMAQAALKGVQLFVETHSDHIINGIRIAVRETELSPDHVAISYFQRSRDEHTTEIQNIRIDKKGKILDWPDGFLDEWNNSLFKLI